MYLGLAMLMAWNAWASLAAAPTRVNWSGSKALTSRPLGAMIAPRAVGGREPGGESRREPSRLRCERLHGGAHRPDGRRARLAADPGRPQRARHRGGGPPPGPRGQGLRPL